MGTTFYIGCSGFHYPLWKGEFYPIGLAKSKWLGHYAQVFNTIEINSSFYKFPTVKSLQGWHDKTPEGYLLAIKAHRIITHYRRFKDTEAQVAAFYEVAREGLKEKLGPVLFQCPPNLVYTPEVLDRIVQAMDASFLNVLEFRHISWWNPRVYETLAAHGLVFCSPSFPKLPEIVVKTQSVGYIRFHGNVELFKSTYNREELERWAKDIREAGFETAYVFFNNTWFNGAVENGQTLKEILFPPPQPLSLKSGTFL